MTTLPQWSTPQRQRQMVKLFHDSRGLCVYGHPQCPKEKHCYEAYLDGLIADWKAEDASRRAVEWQMEWRRIHGIGDGEVKRRITAGHSGKRRKTISAFVETGWSNDYQMVRGQLRHHDPITAERWRESLPLFEIEGYGVDPFTFKKTALVRIPGLAMPIHLFVDVSASTAYHSKNALRKARRRGTSLPTVQDLCKAAVMDWRRKHDLE